MKKILFIAAALFAFAGCDDKKPLDTPKDDNEVKEAVSISPASKAFAKEGGSVDVKVTSTGAWTLTSEEAYDWITPSAKSGKDGDMVKFTASENKTTDSKKAVFTFKTGNATATLNITIAAGDAPYLNSDTKSFEFKEDGGTVEVKVNSNIEYTYTPDANWISYKETKSGNIEVFTVDALPAGTDSRSGNITFAGKDDSSLKFEVAVSQKRESSAGGDDALITTVGKFSATRAYPKWDGKATAFENLSEFTFEALVYHEGGWKSLNTILGIDGYFMIRCGDDGIQRNEIQVATSADDSTDETKLNSGVLLDENKWYHIAVTFNKGTIKLYVDGEEKGTLVATNTSKRSFNREHTDEPGGWGATRCFWVGYSCGVSRCWSGMMSEIRVWNKALTASDLKAKNHFYKVDAKASGLIAYWKFNEGEGNVVKDQTSNGNNLYCQTNVKNDPPTTATAEDGMEWATVSLPE